MVRGARLVVLLGMVLALPGCGRTVVAQGTPTPGRTSAPATPTSLVSRPKEVRLVGIDPCSLVTPETRQRFGIDRPPIPAKSYVFESPACSFRNSNEKVAFQVVTGIKAGIEVMAPGRAVGARQDYRVRGFPALELRTDGAPPASDFCTASIDVAPGNMLQLQYREDGIRPPLGKDELCRRVRLLADAVVGTLLERE
ncbi:Protein of unknown function (DUF3558) [Streptoalloteichus tenebrarius]|uniref:DUF3558 domain-containing protein n=1 Tax=Streptoalloteichus tenebrarius (strain ATCC 17920 / DSM 40477 / JCM 4838 / CBS 697.72 / NBRC 16177 / NCIMB 11028 / NRRL B-12390 / A12253. 1 / ISP 5477) TaxID=1933 RepID=A0ABT1I222_STRSD|nr:DUF3558 domain-containing protein [Streptoalloteichus tenebrarius]MCP2261776.1 Protein of unknown function (DUF3558) [Streptoalloteichus tenebrarius]BFF00833.1 hypothetical protein GCM10020241_25080 [Streptoalloteichus tenebrarius]